MTDEVNSSVDTDEVPKAKVKMSVNLDTMKLRELAVFEDVTGRPLNDLIKMTPVRDPETDEIVRDPEDPKRPLMQANMTSKALMAMVLIARQREEGRNAVTLADVEEMSIEDIDFEVATSVADPTIGPDEVEQPQPDSGNEG